MTYIYEKTLGETNGNTHFTGDKLIIEYVLSSESNEIKVVEMWRVGSDIVWCVCRQAWGDPRDLQA